MSVTTGTICSDVCLENVTRNEVLFPFSFALPVFQNASSNGSVNKFSLFFLQNKNFI